MESKASYEFSAHEKNVHSAAVSPKSCQIIATGGADAKVNIWRVGSRANIFSLSSKRASPIESLCFDSDEMCVISGASGGSVNVYDLSVGQLVRCLGGHNSGVTSLNYHPYGEFLVSGSQDCSMKFWDVRNKSCVETYTGHKKEITCVRFSPDGKWVVSAGQDGQLLFYDLVASKHINTIKLAPAYITSFEFNPTEFSLAAITSNRNIRFWDLETMKLTGSTPPESQPIKTMAYSNLGHQLFTSSKSALKIWDIIENNAVKLEETVEIGWDRNLADLKMVNNDQMVGVSFTGQFVSIWEIDLSAYLSGEAAYQQQNEGDPNDEPPEQQLQKRRSIGQQDNNSNNNNYSDNKREPSPSPAQAKGEYDNNIQKRMGNFPAEEKRNSSPALGGGGGDNDVAAQGKGRFSYPSSNNPASNRSFKDGPSPAPPALELKSAASSPEETTTDYKVSTYDEDEKNRPEVVAEEGYSPAVMASSMRETFFEKFKSSLNDSSNLRNISKDNEEEEYPFDGDEEEVTPPPQPTPMKLGGNALAQLLPPSSYDNDYNNNNQVPINSKHVPRAIGINNLPPATATKPTTSEKSTTPLAAPSIAQQKAAAMKKEMKEHSPPITILSKPSSAHNIHYGNITEVESKGIEALSVMGVRHGHGVPSSSSSANRPPTGGNASNPPPPLMIAAHNSTENDSMKCNEALDRLLFNANQVSGQLSQRLGTLKMLRQLWSKGDVLETLDHLSILSSAMKMVNYQNISVLTDFFSAINLSQQSLTLDSCMKILPILEDMLSMTNNSTFISQSSGNQGEHIVITAYKTLVSLGSTFGELIRSTRSVMSIGGGGGVDLSKEARLNKCNSCYEIFHKGKTRMEMLKYQYRHNNEIQYVLDQYSRICHQYFPN
jgi:hypothetical protein